MSILHLVLHGPDGATDKWVIKYQEGQNVFSLQRVIPKNLSLRERLIRQVAMEIKGRQRK